MWKLWTSDGRTGRGKGRGGRAAIFCSPSQKMLNEDERSGSLNDDFDLLAFFLVFPAAGQLGVPTAVRRSCPYKSSAGRILSLARSGNPVIHLRILPSSLSPLKNAYHGMLAARFNITRRILIQLRPISFPRHASNAILPRQYTRKMTTEVEKVGPASASFSCGI